MRKLSGALVALTASLAFGAMTVAANARHKDNDAGCERDRGRSSVEAAIDC